MPSFWPVCMVDGIWWIFASRMRLRTAGTADEDLARRHPSAALLLAERLGDDRLERLREHRADLVLLAGRKDVDDAVDGLRRARGVQGAEHQVPGLGRGERERDGFQVAHLADEDDVRILAQRAAQRGSE